MSTILELAAFGGFTAAGAIAGGVFVGLIVGSVCLLVVAQGVDDQATLARLRKLARRPERMRRRRRAGPLTNADLDRAA